MADLKWAAQLTDCCNRAGVPLSEDQVAVFAGWLAVIELESQQRIAELEEEVTRLSGRDCSATVELCYEADGYPFAREELTIVDVGVSDNCQENTGGKMSTQHPGTVLHQCPCCPATTCEMDEPCLGCETYSQWVTEELMTEIESGDLWDFVAMTNKRDLWRALFWLVVGSHGAYGFLTWMGWL